MKNINPMEIELIVDTSKFEAILKELCPCFPDDIPFSDLVRVVKLGIVLKGEDNPTLGTNKSITAIVEPLDFLLELLPAVRAGELTFSAFESILEAKSRVWNESDHDK